MEDARTDELDDDQLEALLHESLVAAGAPIRAADLWLSTVAAGSLVNALRLRGARVFLDRVDGA